ncbi:MAG: hypothetical protein GX575_03230 [Candidatus Anammoximicrobium sp.]|nr:hypothetical protein [Candidatus Anammoximicrobium sp.]
MSPARFPLFAWCALWLSAAGCGVVASSATAAEATRQEGSDPSPLWTFAWVTDMHLDASRRAYLAEAFRQLRTEWKPHFVLVTGDNNAHPAPPRDPARPESLGVRRQRFLRAFLDEHLQLPSAIIPGDNWPQDFDAVFGPKQYSFDCGGLHFLLLAPDRICHGSKLEGLSAFDPPTRAWIADDLARHRQRPTIVAIHEPIYPPTFLDARPLHTIVARHPHVVAVLQGHLHRDLDYRSRTTAYLVGPSLGMPPTQALKLVDVHADRLVLKTLAYHGANGRFELLDRRQTVEIAESLRGGLAVPAGRFEMANYDALPARPLIQDPQLSLRLGEMLRNAAGFFLPP